MTINQDTMSNTEAALEALRSLTLEGKYELGIGLARVAPRPTPEMQHWHGICLSGLNRASEAKPLLLAALARGYGDAMGALAAVCRQLGENTTWLGTLEEGDLDALSDFGRA
ncbi:MAG: hypothetical protein HC933_14690, partial [Pleurocapsa sp. SU_196_0]|nr:hypothetical protein [Pleurocapsa sp. SU_196_0]